MKILISGSVIIGLVAAMVPATGMTAMSIEQQDYVFKMDTTRDITASTFVIGESNRTKQLRPPVAISAAEKNKMHLAIKKRETFVTGEKQIENVHRSVKCKISN